MAVGVPRCMGADLAAALGVKVLEAACVWVAVEVDADA